MKALTLSSILIALALSSAATAQQVNQQPQRNPNVQAKLPGPVVDKKTVNRLQCRIGTADPKVCARDGFTFVPAAPKK